MVGLWWGCGELLFLAKTCFVDVFVGIFYKKTTTNHANRKDFACEAKKHWKSSKIWHVSCFLVSFYSFSFHFFIFLILFSGR